MRGRLGRFIPIIALAILVQIMAPIAATWASATANDPLSSVPICAPGSHNTQAPADSDVADRAACCAFCVLAHAGAALPPPSAPSIAVHSGHELAAWRAPPLRHHRDSQTSPPPATGPPTLS